ncbi:MAG: hypothetical protein AAF927_17060 [Bacteroidota bacterium]
MNNQKSKISQSAKPSLGTKAWTYISIAGALVAIIYAGLSLQEEDNKRHRRHPENIQETQTAKDSAKVVEDIPAFEYDTQNVKERD